MSGTDQIPIWGTYVSQLATASQGDAANGLQLFGIVGAPGFQFFKRVPANVVATALGIKGSIGPTAAQVIAQGAEGRVFNVTLGVGGTTYHYNSTQDGFSLPYLCRTDVTPSGQMLDVDNIIEGLPDYGQSYRAISSVLPPIYPPIPGGLPSLSRYRDVLRFVTATGHQCGVRGNASDFAAAIDITGTDMSYAGDMIGVAAAIALQKFRDRDNMQVRPVVSYCGAFPGYTWPELMPGTDPWTQWIAEDVLAAGFAAHYGKTILYTGVGWSHGVPGIGAVRAIVNGVNSYDYYDALSQFMADTDAKLLNAAYDALMGNTMPTLVHYFADQTPSPTGTSAPLQDQQRMVDFAVANSARWHSTGSRSSDPFQDHIHPNAVGSLRAGEREGFVKHWVIDKQQPWGTFYCATVAISGNHLRILVNPPFLAAQLAIDTTTIEAALNLGLFVSLDNNVTFLTLANIGVNGIQIDADLPVTLANGATASFSYAYWNSNAGILPGVHSPSWGNIKTVLAPSVFFEDGSTCDLWLLTTGPQTVTAGPTLPVQPLITSLVLTPNTLLANQPHAVSVGVLSVTTQGVVGPVVFTLLSDGGGYFTLFGDGVTIRANGGCPDGSFVISVQGFCPGAPPFVQDITITSILPPS